jgi:hypothetical protein
MAHENDSVAQYKNSGYALLPFMGIALAYPLFYIKYYINELIRVRLAYIRPSAIKNQAVKSLNSRTIGIIEFRTRVSAS